MRRIAYLVSQYPALSHAFIAREIAELRAAGCDVTVLSVRRPEPDSLRFGSLRVDAAETIAIQGLPARSLLAAHLHCLQQHPRAWFGTAVRSVGLGRGLRGRFKHLMYFAEAVPVFDLLNGHGVRHVHVHFANNAADIAELTVDLGDRVDGGGRWSWSMSMHGPTEFGDPQRFRLAAKVTSAAFVACISEFCRQQVLAAAPGTATEKLPVVHMGVDVEKFPAVGERRQARIAARSGSGAPTAPLRVLFVGRLVPEKAPVDLIDALAQVGRPIEARIIGAGPQRERVQERIAAHGLLTSVHCLGALGQDELPVNYAWADVFCLPSHSEGVPVVLMEAMSTELPVISTDIAGISELVDDTNGILLSPGDVGALADALRFLADNPGHRAELGRRGRETVIRDYRSSVNARRLLSLLEVSSHGPKTSEGRRRGGVVLAQHRSASLKSSAR